EQTAHWLGDNLPEQSEPALLHNDFKYDNLVLADSDHFDIIGVLDWEMATVGEPLMDLGTSLAYWSQENDPQGLQAFGLTSLPGNFSRQELVNHYAELSGRNVDDIQFYYRFGLYKLAVILQQIYARYHAGKTRDPRFATLIDLVRLCARQSLDTDLG
ncbi:MAG: phosphotransferase, partial [Gammaproteobacteria bacterium]|nr:phosphotransferase [Gammaproteobacteria bacterium]